MLPELTDEQRREALGKAVEMRRTRAALKRAVKDGSVSVAVALEADAAQGMRALDLLRALPGYGEARARALMERVGIAPNRRVRGLGPRQRAAIAEEASR